MKRTSSGTILLILGALVLAIALWSSGWLLDRVADDYGRSRLVEHDLEGVLGRITLVAGAIAILLAVPMSITRGRALCTIGIVAAVTTLFGAIGGAVKATDVAIGPGTLAGVVGAVFVLVGAMLVMEPAEPRVEPPPHDGRRLVYDVNGRLARIEQWADGKMQSSRQVGVDGLTVDEPAEKKA